MDDHLLNQRVMDEELRDLSGMIGGDKNVEIPDRLLATAEAPRLTDLPHSFMGAQVVQQLIGKHSHHIDAKASRVLAVIPNGLQ